MNNNCHPVWSCCQHAGLPQHMAAPFRQFSQLTEQLVPGVHQVQLEALKGPDDTLRLPFQTSPGRQRIAKVCHCTVRQRALQVDA